MAMPQSPLLSPSSWLDASLDTFTRSFRDVIVGYWWIILIVTIVIVLTTSPKK